MSNIKNREQETMIAEVAIMLITEKLEFTKENISKMMLKRIDMLCEAKKDKSINEKIFNLVN